MLVLRSFPAALRAVRERLEQLEERDLREPPTPYGRLAVLAERIAARGSDADDAGDGPVVPSDDASGPEYLDVDATVYGGTPDADNEASS